jgi:hypothetical protein
MRVHRMIEKIATRARSLLAAASACLLVALLASCTGGADTPGAESSGTRAEAGQAAGWRDLFDGATLDGWHNPYDWGEAWVESGEIRLRADRKFFLMTRESFRDFVFEGEVMLPDTASNSGFMFRANVEQNRVYGYQAEVDPKARRWSGGLYDEERRGWLNPPAEDTAAQRAFREEPGTAFRPDEWNRYRIEARGDSLRIYVNDRLTTAYRDTLDREGPIGIQHHGEAGKVYRFRNLRIQPLGAAEGP